MNELYKQALNGTLKPKRTGNPHTTTVAQTARLSLIGKFLRPDGSQGPGITFNSYQGLFKYELKDVYEGDIIVFSCGMTGSFVGLHVFVKKDFEPGINFITPVMCTPNDIGELPRPTKDVPIPVSSPRVCVGHAYKNMGSNEKPDSRYIMREQFWQRSGDSYMLAAGETRTVSYTETSGMEHTTSQQDTIAESLGVSASAGWGPISASISASLSVTSSTFQEVTLRNQTTKFESVELKNNTEKSRFFIKWALVDVITIFGISEDHKNIVPLASSISKEHPVLIDGPFDIDNLPTREYEAIPDDWVEPSCFCNVVSDEFEVNRRPPGV